MSEIAIRSGSGQVAAAGATAMAVQTDNYTGTVLEFSELPTEFPSTGTDLALRGESMPNDAPPMATWAEQLDKPRRRDGRVVQVRNGWRARRGDVAFFDVERDLTKGSDGKYRPSGEWRLYKRRAMMVKPVVRTSTFPDMAQKAPSVPGFATSRTYDVSSDEALLPGPVQDSLIGHVPSPNISKGESIRYSGGPRGERYEVSWMRANDNKAVVVHAVLSNSMWNVTMMVYEGQWTTDTVGP